MKKIAFLGCENSHSDIFLKIIKENPKYSDIEVLGVYSDEVEASKKLADKYGVKVLDNYDSVKGQVDGVIITARHGDSHYKFAKPYLEKGMTLFIDKPITISEAEALEMMQKAKELGVKVTGGSSVKYNDIVLELKNDAKNEVGGETTGGVVRCPVSMTNPWGNFFFYSQHLVEVLCSIFGYYPKSVKSFKDGDAYTVVFRYEKYAVIGIFQQYGDNSYYACRLTIDNAKGGSYKDLNDCFKREFDEFYRILSGGEQATTYSDFISPVYVMNAIQRSMDSGNEELVNTYEV